MLTRAAHHDYAVCFDLIESLDERLKNIILNEEFLFIEIGAITSLSLVSLFLNKIPRILQSKIIPQCSQFF